MLTLCGFYSAVRAYCCVSYTPIQEIRSHITYRSTICDGFAKKQMKRLKDTFCASKRNSNNLTRQILT